MGPTVHPPLTGKGVEQRKRARLSAHLWVWGCRVSHRYQATRVYLLLRMLCSALVIYSVPRLFGSEDIQGGKWTRWCFPWHLLQYPVEKTLRWSPNVPKGSQDGKLNSCSAGPNTRISALCRRWVKLVIRRAYTLLPTPRFGLSLGVAHIELVALILPPAI